MRVVRAGPPASSRSRSCVSLAAGHLRLLCKHCRVLLAPGRLRCLRSRSCVLPALGCLRLICKHRCVLLSPGCLRSRRSRSCVSLAPGRLRCLRSRSSVSLAPGRMPSLAAGCLRFLRTRRRSLGTLNTRPQGVCRSRSNSRRRCHHQHRKQQQQSTVPHCSGYDTHCIRVCGRRLQPLRTFPRF